MLNNQTIDDVLYPSIEPSKTGYLKVSDLHQIYYATYGNPKGHPVLFLHGGPGVGFRDLAPRYFDPNFYHIICFDQRGAYRSLPFAELRENTTHELVEDIEKLRLFFNVDNWLLMGGSWGTALALAYGQSYPERCKGFILRGICLANTDNTRNLYYEMRNTFPKEWQRFSEYIPLKERDDLVKAYNKRLISIDDTIVEEAAMELCRYDFSCMMLEPLSNLNIYLSDKKHVIGMAKILTYYCLNNFFLEENTLLNNINKIAHIPARIIHGRYDIICRIYQAYDLHKKWNKSELIVHPLSGHADVEPIILSLIRESADHFKSYLIK